ncbi:MAG: hypothetical protein ACI9U2_002918 [Bradymonadia bacterium]|jgi:hypothetical protein
MLTALLISGRGSSARDGQVEVEDSLILNVLPKDEKVTTPG